MTTWKAKEMGVSRLWVQELDKMQHCVLWKDGIFAFVELLKMNTVS